METYKKEGGVCHTFLGLKKVVFGTFQVFSLKRSIVGAFMVPLVPHPLGTSWGFFRNCWQALQSFLYGTQPGAQPSLHLNFSAAFFLTVCTKVASLPSLKKPSYNFLGCHFWLKSLIIGQRTYVHPKWLTILVMWLKQSKHYSINQSIDLSINQSFTVYKMINEFVRLLDCFSIFWWQIWTSKSIGCLSVRFSLINGKSCTDLAGINWF